MTDVVEVFWNARPHLERRGANLKRGDLDAASERLIQEVRRAVVEAFPGCATLVRIAVRSGDPQADLRIVRGGVEQSDHLPELRAVIEKAMAQAQPATA